MAQRFLVPLILIFAFTLSACKEDPVDEVVRVEQEWAVRDVKIKQIKDADIRRKFAQMALLLASIDELHAAAKIPPEETRYTPIGMERLNDYANLTEMTGVFLGASALENFSTSLTMKYPFDYPLPHEISLTSVQLTDGYVVMIRDEPLEDSRAIQAIRSRSDIRMVYDPNGGVPEGQALPTQVSGTFTTELPGAVLQVRFDKGDVGEIRQAGEYSVTLLQVDRHQVAIKIVRIDGEMLAIDANAISIEAKDQTGRYLEEQSSSWGNPEVFAELIKAFDLALEMATDSGLTEVGAGALFDNALNIGDLKDPAQMYGAANFRGVADQVLVTILVPTGARTFTKDFVMPVYAGVGSRGSETLEVISVSGPVYNHETEAMMRYQPVDLTPDEITTAITIAQSDYDHTIYFNYPNVQSGIFINKHSRFEDEETRPVPISFLDAKGRPIEIESEYAFELASNSIEYDPTLFSRPPVRVTGQILVQRLIDLKQERYRAEALPEGLEVRGNMLLIDFEAFPNWGSDIQAFATNVSGRYLTRFHKQYLRGQRQGVEYYYGDIAGVVLFERGASETIPYNFDVKLELLE